MVKNRESRASLPDSEMADESNAPATTNTTTDGSEHEANDDGDVSMDDADNQENENEDEDGDDEEVDEENDDGDDESVAPADGRRRRSFAVSKQKKAFGKKNENLNQRKENDSTKRIRYLLGLTDLFRHFMGNNPDYLRIQAEEEEKKKNSKGKKASAAENRRRRTEQEEDEELLQDEEGEGEAATLFTESPPFVKGGTMRDYQIAGLNWLISLHENGISGILADEMGLGKTLQTISFLGYLRHVAGVNGPHLVTVPKSTLDNWKREFDHWTPGVNVLVLQGTKEERAKLIHERVLTQDFDVMITSYEMILREKTHLKKFAWEYIIVDEAHRIKNEESALAQIIRIFNSRNRLLITGTPLQNNLHELWALLNFLLPDVFGDSSAFDQWFETQGGDQDMVVQQLHKVLRPFLLRRVKSDVEKSLLPKKEVNVYIGMSEMQVKWYQKILEKDIDAVNGAGGKRESKTRLLNIVMQLRKCCNHPYLFEGAEPGPPYTTDEHIIDNSGKMVMLDKLLKRMKAQGSRILIFSQMSRQLDILEDYCVFREYNYCRIDGSTAHEDRIAAIDDYNKPGSDKFIFLLTTRAGGLGINLTTADIVVLYDSDWNPQADLQAMDRAHRIGQTKQVMVFRFVTENAIEEKVLERAAQKLRLDQLVIQQSRAQLQTKAAASKDELLSMIQHGADVVFKNSKDKENQITQDMTDDDINAILERGEQRTKELNARYAKLGLDDLQKFTSDSAYEWNGENFAAVKKTNIGANWINPAKRERKEQSYGIDNYYRQVLTQGSKQADTKPKVPRAPKQVSVHEHQFYPQRLVELQEMETAYFKKQQGYKAVLRDGTEDTLEEREAARIEEQETIDNAVPLTEAEQEEKTRLGEQGFSNWSRKDFMSFIQLSAKYGRKSISAIAADIESKTEKEVREYAKVFWDRYKEMPSWEKYIATIEAGEDKSEKITKQKKLLRRKIEMYRVPLQQLKLNYSVSTTNKKIYTEEEDRFLLVHLDKFGLDAENLHDMIRDEIRESPLFRFDWFFLSRTSLEISRRCTTLIMTVMREFENEATNGTTATTGTAKPKKGRDREEEEEEERGPPAKKGKGAAGAAKEAKVVPAETNGKLPGRPPKNKAVEQAKKGAESKATSAATSRASSVDSKVSTAAAASSKKGTKSKKK
ncbi:hypothetical protein P167DRAFT_505286 [Morchella conica CCBAS932]|uniref:Chromatin remodelling complex ATPase chain ISW1 n=1 Tax=Morchella conica CCBAS932 TaxID=1392247 RepID=A0A3N4KS34_9PEZI|nr:hypothetical protein P167DRAFT_505286 [Morchella conica CCBAS932]